MRKKNSSNIGNSGTGATAFFMTAAAVGTVAAVLLSYAVLSVCAALITTSSGESAGLPASSDMGVLSDSCGDGYIAAMASVSLPSGAGIGDAVFTGSKPDDVMTSTETGTEKPIVPSLSKEAEEAFPEISVSAECAALMCVETGELLYEKNADLRHAMASTTKIMTALVALENCKLDNTVTVSSDAVGIIGSSVYLYAGEQMTMESLLYALLLESANDAAAAIAIEVSGSIEGFAELMNEKAASLGLEHTHFTNPHGLDNEDHYTTARELAALTSAALQNETFREIVSTYKKSIEMHNGQGSRLLINHNKLLKSYDGAIGVKTGYTSNSGRCLVTAASRDGLTYIAVTLNAPDDWNDHRKMLDAGFGYYVGVTLAEPGSESRSLPVVGAKDTDSITVSNHNGASAILRSGDTSVTSVVELPHFVYAPVSEGVQIGKIRYYHGDTEVGSVELYTETGAEEEEIKLSFFDKLKAIFGF
ncbi:MAG: D-alanyl-D-alanine carboxypeptidase family protein [Clostridia bacterium]|nr:D-alanyl-D-alanine carboxypeptidase family protein [Clostridia bacterium]